MQKFQVAEKSADVMAPVNDDSSEIDDLPKGWNGRTGSDEENKQESPTISETRNTRSKLSLKEAKIEVLSQRLTGPTRSRGGSSSRSVSTNARSSKASETSGQEETERKRSKRYRYRHRVVDRSARGSSLTPAEDKDREPLLERVLESMDYMHRTTRETVERSAVVVEKLTQQVQKNALDNEPVLERVLESMNNIMTCTQEVMAKISQQVINQTETLTIIASQFKEMNVINEEGRAAQLEAFTKQEQANAKRSEELTKRILDRTAQVNAERSEETKQIMDQATEAFTKQMKAQGRAAKKENQKLNQGLEANLKKCIENNHDKTLQRAKQLHEKNREELIELHETKTQFVLRLEKTKSKWITSEDVLTALRRANYDKIRPQDIRRISNITGKRKADVEERVEIALVQLRTEAQTQKLMFEAYNMGNEELAKIIRRAKTSRLRNDEKAVRRKAAAKNNCKGPREAIPNWGTWRCDIRYKKREKNHPLYATKEEDLPPNWWEEQSREEWRKKNVQKNKAEEQEHSPEIHRAASDKPKNAQ